MRVDFFFFFPVLASSSVKRQVAALEQVSVMSKLWTRFTKNSGRLIVRFYLYSTTLKMAAGTCVVSTGDQRLSTRFAL